MSEKLKSIIKISLIILAIASIIATVYILLSNEEKTVESAKKFAEKCKEKKENLFGKLKKCNFDE